MKDDFAADLQNANVQAFLRVIRAGETNQSENAYRMMFGGGLFDDLSDHPRKAVTRGGLTSTAAGAYQFLARTWDECKKALDLPDFSPASQDLAAVYLIARRWALSDVIQGKLDFAISKCNREWASLPGSPYGQPTRTYEQAVDVFQKYGGTLYMSDERVEETPEIEHIPAGEVIQEKPMAPFIATALPYVLDAVPALIDMFKGDSKSASRNSEAAKVVVGIAKDALGAVNEQDLVEKIQSDPVAQQTVRKAVEDRWFEIQKVVDQSTAEARKFATEYSRTKDVRVVWLNMTFIELLTFFLVISGVAGGLAVLKWGDVGADLKGAIITLILIESVVGARKFWLGNTQPPSRDQTKE